MTGDFPEGLNKTKNGWDAIVFMGLDGLYYGYVRNPGSDAFKDDMVACRWASDGTMIPKWRPDEPRSSILSDIPSYDEGFDLEKAS